MRSMTTRRQLLKGGSAAVDRERPLQLRSVAPRASERRVAALIPVIVGGERIKTIDVHAHCVITEAAKLLRSAPPATVRGATRW